MIKECMFCSKPTNGKLDNLYKLGVKCEGGCFYCHRCGSKGSWYDFLRHVGNLPEIRGWDGASLEQKGSVFRGGVAGKILS